MKFILGSSSKGRRDVLTEAGYTFEVVTPDLDEKSIKTDNPRDLPLAIARTKADALKTKISGLYSEPAIVIAGDQIVLCDGHIQGKPDSEEEARIFYQRYNAGHPAETISALIVFNTATGQSAEGIDIAKVFLKPMNEDVISAYLASGIPMTCSGAFGIEHKAMAPYIDRVEGDRNSVRGIPIPMLEELIARVS